MNIDFYSFTEKHFKLCK